MSEVSTDGSIFNGVVADIAEINPRTDIALTEEEQVSFLPMQNTSESGDIITLQSRLLSEVSKGYTRFAENDVLVAKITPCFENGKGGFARGLLNGIGFGSTEFHVVRAIPGKADSKFLHHLTRSERFRRAGERSMTGSAGQKRIPAEFIREFPIFVPPLPEQKKIAEILSAVDKRIMLGKLDCDKHALLVNATIKSAIDRLVASSSACSLLSAAAICEKIFVGIASSTTHAYTDKTGIPMLRNQNIRSDTIDDTDLVFIKRDFANEQKSRRLLQGDVITARTGYPGTSAVVSKKFENCHSFTTLISRVDKRIVLPEYYSLYLNSPQGKAQVAQLQAGGAQENLNVGALEKMIIPIPDQGVQESIVRASQELLRTHRAKDLVVRKYESLKAALSADLLSGRKRVTL